MEAGKINEMLNAFSKMDLKAISSYSGDICQILTGMNPTSTPSANQPDKITPAVLNEIAVSKIYIEIKKLALDNALKGSFVYELPTQSRKVILAVQSKLINEGFEIELLNEPEMASQFNVCWV